MNYLKKISTSVFKRTHRRNRTESDLDDTNSTEETRTHLKTLSDSSLFISFPKPVFEEEFVDEPSDLLLPDLDPIYVDYREHVQKHIDRQERQKAFDQIEAELDNSAVLNGMSEDLYGIKEEAEHDHQEHVQIYPIPYFETHDFIYNRVHPGTPVASDIFLEEGICYSAPTYHIRPSRIDYNCRNSTLPASTAHSFRIRNNTRRVRSL